MQKRALLPQDYKTVYTPLPTAPEQMLYLDEASMTLPYAEDFPKLHYHDRYEIGICESGDGLFLSEGMFFPISKGDLVFIAPHRRHYSRSLHEDQPCVCRFAYLKSEPLAHILACATAQSERKASPDALAASLPAIIHVSEHPSAAAKLSELFELCKTNTDQRDPLLALKLSTFLLESQAFFNADASRVLPPSRQDDAVAMISEYLSLHYNGNETAKTLAAKCFISESQLRRRFIAVYEMPPIAYRNLLRCRIAAELLTKTTLSISEISERIGYASASDFYRAYKKHYGTSPSAYRKKNSCVF